MKPQQFAILALAAVLSVVVAIATYTAQAPTSSDAAAGAPLFPGIEKEGDKIARIEIKQGDTVVLLSRKGADWMLEDRGGFPASTEKIRSFVASLAEAKLAEPKTRNPERYADLELDDPDAKTASSRRIRLMDEGGKVLAEVVAGKTRADAFGTNRSGSYVRKADDKQTWLVTSEISGGTKLSDWTKPRVYETATERIKKAHIEPAGSQAYDIERDPEGTHKLVEVPAGKKLKFVNMLDNIIEAVSFLELEDVRKADAGAGNEIGAASFETDTGLKVALKFRRDGANTWAAIVAEGEGDAKKPADDIMTRARGWEFKILPSKVETILKRHEELLEDNPS